MYNTFELNKCLNCICAVQYLEFDGKLFCPSLYTYYGVCLIHVWHVLIWNPSDTGVKL
jgi:hypothetical protein